MRNTFWGLLFVILGILLLLDNLDIADFGEVVGTCWPIIIIILGLSIVMKKRHHAETINPTNQEQFGSDLLHQSNVFGDITMSVVSQNFKGGSVSTVFGNCDLDLSKSIVADGEHILRIHSVFGDSTIILPKDTAVSVSANTVFGDVNTMGQRKGGFSPKVETSSPGFESSNKKLKIVVSKVFGDVKIF
jgi:predicted membrane protein